jgi:Tautomerase enzyme
MPLLRFDLVEGRSEPEIRKILDATDEVLLETLKVPKHDRYQVVHEHKRSRMIVERHRFGICQVGPGAPASSHQPPAKPRDEGKLLSLARRG